MSPVRVAYLVSRYPAMTHAFISSEVRAMRAAGVELHTASVRRADPAELLSAADEREFMYTRALLPATPLRLARDHWRALRRDPAGYLATLAFALRAGAGGGRALLWQLFYFAEAAMLWAWLEERGLRHVHVHFANVSSDVAMLATRLGGTLFGWSLTIHGPTELNDVVTHRLALKLREADAVVCTSDYVRAQLISAGDREDWRKLRTIHSGVDLTMFTPSPRPLDRTRTIEILNVAGMSVRKGQSVLLSAFAELRRRHPDVRLTLVGDGPERAALERRACALDLGDSVQFVGALGHDRVADAYRRADVFCLPSYAEGVPTVLMEAMASGLPVVATHVMGVPELVDRSSGLLVAPGRDDQLADALDRLAGDGELRTRMGQAARRRVEAHHDAAQAALALRGLLDELPTT